ncbi:MAG TPA: AmmeMemoRadiSam system protein A [Gammaproteobacteria bacterium]|nr:AmmeMemoRadiSam system protein A [Gammaproteobacteria bacterium]
MPLETTTRATLLRVARESIRRRFAHDDSLPEVGIQDPALLEPRATFVTLMCQHDLRGCIGTLEAHRPLLQDVAHNARAAAFHDPRFSPLAQAELTMVRIEISVLSRPEPFPVQDREELLQRLEPGRHGLILQEGTRRATFLPAVWESLPKPEDFLEQLMHKAGLPRHHWSHALRCFVYTTESFSETQD